MLAVCVSFFSHPSAYNIGERQQVGWGRDKLKLRLYREIEREELV